jgi:hypothetical protein
MQIADSLAGGRFSTHNFDHIALSLLCPAYYSDSSLLITDNRFLSSSLNSNQLWKGPEVSSFASELRWLAWSAFCSFWSCTYIPKVRKILIGKSHTFARSAIFGLAEWLCETRNCVHKDTRWLIDNFSALLFEPLHLAGILVNFLNFLSYKIFFPSFLPYF